MPADPGRILSPICCSHDPFAPTPFARSTSNGDLQPAARGVGRRCARARSRARATCRGSRQVLSRVWLARPSTPSRAVVRTGPGAATDSDGCDRRTLFPGGAPWMGALVRLVVGTGGAASGSCPSFAARSNRQFWNMVRSRHVGRHGGRITADLSAASLPI